MISSIRRATRVAVCLFSTLIGACAGSSNEFDAYGPFIDSLMTATGVPGAEFALFNDTGLLYEHISGVKNSATAERVDDATVFEAASISKPLFAYIVIAMSNEGVLGLDQPLSELVDEIPAIGYDPRSARITPRMLLTHRGGLPNWRSRLNFDAADLDELFAADDTLRFGADPDTGYRYSGEGYVLLQRVVQEITGKDLQTLAREYIFAPLGMSRSSFVFDSAMRTDYAMGHNAEGVPDKWELRAQLASSTLHTTATDLARFGTHLATEIRNDGPHAIMSMPATTDTINNLEVGWGAGLGTVRDGPRRYVYHGGNNVIFIADMMYGVSENIGYVLLTNSANGSRMIDSVETRVFGRNLRP